MIDARMISVDLMIESTGGGSMRHVMDLYEALVVRGHDTRIIVSLTRAEPRVRDWLDTLPRRQVIRADTSRAPHPRDLGLVRMLRARLGSENRPRLLHAHSTKAGILASLLRGQTSGTILTPHAYRGMDPSLPPLNKYAIGLVEQAFSRRMDHVIAVSPEEVVYARGLGLPEPRISYIANGIDLSAIAARAKAGRVGLAAVPRNPPVVGFVGRMTRQKNPLLFLETFARLHRNMPNLRGVMIGDGELSAQVHAHRSALGLESAVDLPGALDFTHEMHRMDILVHTSLYESLPYVLLEAGAGGLAVVAVRNAGSEAIWPDQPLPDQTPDALAAALTPLVTEPAALRQARDIAAAGAARFSITAMAEQTEAVYRRVLDRSAKG